MALANLDLQALPQPLGLIRPISLLEIVVTGRLEEITKILVRSSIAIVIKKAILLTNTLSLINQETSIDLGNFHIGDWC